VQCELSWAYRAISAQENVCAVNYHRWQSNQQKGECVCNVSYHGCVEQSAERGMCVQCELSRVCRAISGKGNMCAM
jgi:hypothetical protein